MKKVYLDYAATTPTDPEVIAAMEPYFFEKFGNASSLHAYGQEAKKALEDSRQSLADFIGAAPEEIVFTSGGTESDNFALLGVAYALEKKGNHIITSSSKCKACDMAVDSGNLSFTNSIKSFINFCNSIILVDY